jgi:hypothetical protein
VRSFARLAQVLGGLRIPDCALLHVLQQFIDFLRLFFQVLALLSNKALKFGPLRVQLPELCLPSPLLPLPLELCQAVSGEGGSLDELFELLAIDRSSGAALLLAGALCQRRERFLLRAQAFMEGFAAVALLRH